MHPISFIEIGAPEASDEARFFGDLFGWTWKPMGDGGQGWFEAGGIKLGVHGDDARPAAIPYFQVEDLIQAAERVIELGGRADLPGADEPGFGRFVNCTSAQGVRFGLHVPPAPDA